MITKQKHRGCIARIKIIRAAGKLLVLNEFDFFSSKSKKRIKSVY